MLEPFPSVRVEVQGTYHHDVDLRPIDQLEQLAFSTQHGIPVETEPPRRRIIVDESNHAELFHGMTEQFAEHERTRFACAVNGQAKARTPTPGIFTNQAERRARPA